VASVLAAPQLNPNDITIVKQEEVNNIGVGGYHFSYEQSDGQKREETAELKNEGTDNESLSVVGSFSFIAPDGHTYRCAIFSLCLMLHKDFKHIIQRYTFFFLYLTH